MDTTDVGKQSMLSAVPYNNCSVCPQVKQFYNMLKHLQRVDPAVQRMINVQTPPYFTNMVDKPLFNTVTAFCGSRSAPR